MRATLEALVYAAGRNTHAAEVLRSFFAHRAARAAAPVERAIAMDEFAAGHGSPSR